MFYSWVFSGLNYVAAGIEIVKYQKYSNMTIKVKHHSMNSSKLQLYWVNFRGNLIKSTNKLFLNLKHK